MASEWHGGDPYQDEPPKNEIKIETKFLVKAFLIAKIGATLESMQRNTRIPVNDWFEKSLEFMNAQQRRKERRKLESNRKFSVGDRVRIHHKHKDDFNTMTSQTVISYGWSEKVKVMLYQLDQSLGSDFQEDDLVEDTRDLRRQNLKL